MKSIREDKKADFKVVAGMIIVIVAMIIIIAIIRGNLINTSGQIKFCEDSKDYDGDGIPDRMDSCVCLDKSICDKGDKKAIAKCVEERYEFYECSKS
jgi:hypothetical protein